MLTAITRAVSPTLTKCELTCRDREPIDVGRASMEHANYLAILFELGIEVITIPADPELPDCVFVEDQAFVLDELAVITRSGARSRRAERDAIAQELSQLRPLQWIRKPGRIDGGDILRLGRRLFVGRSSRSDDEGLRQLAKIVQPLDYEVIAMPMKGCLHLKSACCPVGESRVIANRDWIDDTVLDSIEVIDVPKTEPYGANVLTIKNHAIVSAAHPQTEQLLREQGLTTHRVDNTELLKAESGVTCCSLLVDRRLSA